MSSPPPGEQALYTRYSLVFFTRPNNAVRLTALKDESPLIAEAVGRAPDSLQEIFAAGFTSYEWFTRRVKNMRTKNQNVRVVLDDFLLIQSTDDDLCCNRVQMCGVRAGALSIARAPHRLICMHLTTC